jgi:hypothetical protein
MALHRGRCKAPHKSPEPATNNLQLVPDLLRCSKPSRWWQPPRETRIPQQMNTQVPTRCKLTSKYTWDHSISLWLGKQAREMSGTGCAQLKRMLESQNVQERPPQTGQTHIYKQSQRIEPLGTIGCCLRTDQTHPVKLIGRGQRPVAPTRLPRWTPRVLILNLIRSIVTVT